MLPVKLVFVDDDPDDRDLLIDSLSALGVDPFLVLDSGPSLFTYLESLNGQNYPKAVVLDLNMPIMGGFEILQKLKADNTYKRIQVYILTTAASESIKQKCLVEGAASYYIKPNSIVELNTILNDIYDAT